MTSELEKLRRALESMPSDDRAVFECARFDGEDYSTIASALGIDIAEVERRIASAMLHLSQETRK